MPDNQVTLDQFVRFLANLTSSKDGPLYSKLYYARQGFQDGLYQNPSTPTDQPESYLAGYHFGKELREWYESFCLLEVELNDEPSQA